MSRISKLGNDKHNPGEEMHHARGKSTDHLDCAFRHSVDADDMLTARERDQLNFTDEQILTEVNQFVWRAMAWGQEVHEKLGAPLAPAARIWNGD